MQKVSVNAGFTCPNRDGSKSKAGCAYCNNTSFRPAYCTPELTITQQLDHGVSFFSGKYPEMRFLAYLQSYSNTYGDLELLDRLYSEALAHEAIDGLVIGTRPDCIDDAILDMLSEKARNRFIMIEYGVESTLDRTLNLINRHHSYHDAISAIKATKKRGIYTGAHLILGLPGESRKEMLEHATKISQLPLDTLKLHHLQIIRNTSFASIYRKQPEYFHLFECDEFLDLIVEFLERLSPSIAIDRFVNQAPHDELIAPKWGLKNFEIVARIEKRLKSQDTWQGRRYIDQSRLQPEF